MKLAKKQLKKVFLEADEFAGGFDFGSEFESFKKIVGDGNSKVSSVNAAEINAIVPDFNLLGEKFYPPKCSSFHSGILLPLIRFLNRILA